MQAIRGYVRGVWQCWGWAGVAPTHSMLARIHRQVLWLKCPAIETSTGMGQKNGPVADILRPRLLIHELSTYLWNFFSTLPTTVTPHFEQFQLLVVMQKSRVE